MSESPTVKQAHPPPQPPGNGAGKPSQAGSAFAEALLAAVRDQESSEGQAHVATALALGWFLAALAHPVQPGATAAAARGDLVGAGALDEPRVVELCRSHVQAALTKLEGVVAPTGLTLPDLTALEAAPEDERRGRAAALDAEVQGLLSATDFRLSKAYAAGRALMNLCTRPGHGTIEEHLTAASVAPLAADIDDLSSALAPHAGHSVRASLLEWERSVGGVAPDESETWLALARQGELWRALLTGEKHGRDMLEIEDYLDAADRLSARMREVGVRLLKKFPEVVIGVVLLFAAGIALIALTDNAAAIAAGAGAVLASLGLSWRGIGKSVGGLAGKLERPRWGAELDTSITQAITLLPREQGRDVAKERRHVALALGAGSATVVGDRAGSSAVRAADS
jgi:hypothetical protein